MKSPRSRRHRWPLAASLAFVALAALIFAAARPMEERTAIRLAGDLIRKHGDPAFDDAHYRVASITRSGDGRFLRVDFEKTSGPGLAKTSATVPVERTRAMARRWW